MGSSSDLHESQAHHSDAGAPAEAGPCETSLQVTDSGVTIAVTRLAVDAASVERSMALLCDDERHRASTFIFERDRRRFASARAWLRQLLGGWLGVHAARVEFSYGVYGKPALGGRFATAGVRFNLSHCDDLAVCALALDREVGVDVEAVRALDEADALAVRYFSDRERESYLALDRRDRPLGFFRCWTRKEAFIKALGHGFAHPLDTFDVTLSPGEPARILRVNERSGRDSGWHLESLVPEAGFVAAVVSRDHWRRLHPTA